MHLSPKIKGIRTEPEVECIEARTRMKAGAPVCSGSLLCSLSNMPWIGLSRYVYMFALRDRKKKRKARLSLTVLISVITPHLQVFSPDLWRTVNSYQAVSLSPSPSLSPMSYFSAAAEQSHASFDSSCRVTSAGGDIWHTRPLMVRIHIQQDAARDRCTFTQKASSFTVIWCVIYVEEWLRRFVKT